MIGLFYIYCYYFFGYLFNTIIMPPVYQFKKINVVSNYDGHSRLDLRSDNINLLYIPNFLSSLEASRLFTTLSEDDTILHQNSYKGNFGRQITPKRLTYAHVPSDRRYRFKGLDLHKRENKTFTDIFSHLSNKLVSDEYAVSKPNASIVNGYRYNGIDNIALHTDDEKFLDRNNTEFWTDSAVFTVTLLANSDKPMPYYAGDVETGDGVAIHVQHGSLLIQGSILHEVRPLFDRNIDLGRISVTLRSLNNWCPHGSSNCHRPNCLPNLGPSNYLYYSNPDALAPIPELEVVDKTELEVSDFFKIRMPVIDHDFEIEDDLH